MRRERQGNICDFDILGNCWWMGSDDQKVPRIIHMWNNERKSLTRLPRSKSKSCRELDLFLKLGLLSQWNQTKFSAYPDLSILIRNSKELQSRDKRLSNTRKLNEPLVQVDTMCPRQWLVSERSNKNSLLRLRWIWNQTSSLSLIYGSSRWPYDYYNKFTAFEVPMSCKVIQTRPLRSHLQVADTYLTESNLFKLLKTYQHHWIVVLWWCSCTLWTN